VDKEVLIAIQDRIGSACVVIRKYLPSIRGQVQERCGIDNALHELCAITNIAYEYMNGGLGGIGLFVDGSAKKLALYG